MTTNALDKQLFVRVPTIARPTKYESLTVEGMTTFNPDGSQADQIEVTP